MENLTTIIQNCLFIIAIIFSVSCKSISNRKLADSDLNAQTSRQVIEQQLTPQWTMRLFKCLDDRRKETDCRTLTLPPTTGQNPELTQFLSAIDFSFRGDQLVFGTIQNRYYYVEFLSETIRLAAGSYSIYPTSDDGMRVYLINKATNKRTKLLDDWTTHAPMPHLLSFYVEESADYQVKIDYFQNTGNSKVNFTTFKYRMPPFCKREAWFGRFYIQTNKLDEPFAASGCVDDLSQINEGTASGADSDEYAISLPLQEMAAQHSMNTLYDFTVALERSYRFPFNGRADFALNRHFGRGQLYVDNKLLITGASEHASLQVRKDQSYSIKVVYPNLNFSPANTNQGQQPTHFDFSIKEEILATGN